MRTWTARLVALAFITLGLSGGCGTSTGGGGGRTENLVGGILPPHKAAYALTETSASYLDSLEEDGETDVPRSADLRRLGIIPPVQNQRWNSCVAWTLGYYLMTAVHAKLRCEDASNSDTWFSPDYIYSLRDRKNARAYILGERGRLGDPVLDPPCFEADDDIGCMRPERALGLLMAEGCCKWNWLCGAGDRTDDGEFRSCDLVPEGATTAKSRLFVGPARVGAAEFRPRCFVRFGDLEAYNVELVRDMRAWLHREATPIAIVVRMTEGWVTHRGTPVADYRAGAVNLTCDGEIVPRSVCLDAGGRDLKSRHMMTVIGYDDDWPSRAQFPDLPLEKRGSFLVANQWGDKWGDEGLMWIPYAELSRIWIGAYGIIGRDPEEPVEAGLVCAQDPITGAWVNIAEGDDVPRNTIERDGTLVTEITATRLGADHTDEGGAPNQPGTKLIAAGQHVGALLASDDGEGQRLDRADWYCFRCPAPGTWIKIRTNNPDGSPSDPVTNPRLALFDHEMNLVRNVKWWQGETQIERRLCRAATYFVRVKPTPDQLGTQVGLAYTLEVCFPDNGAVNEHTTDDDPCGARTIPFDFSSDEEVVVGDDPDGATDQIDWWTVTMPYSAHLHFQVGSGRELLLYRGENADTAKRVRWGVLRELDPVVRTGNTVWVGVRRYPTTTSVDRYALRFRVLSRTLENVDTAARVELERDESGSPWRWTGQAAGQFEPRPAPDDPEDGAHYYVVTLPPGATLVAKTTASPAAPPVCVAIAQAPKQAFDDAFDSCVGEATRSLEHGGGGKRGWTDMLVAVWSPDDLSAPLPYQLALEATFATEDDNDDPESIPELGIGLGARAMYFGVLQVGTLGPGDTQDWFYFDAGPFERPQDVVMTISGFCHRGDAGLAAHVRTATGPDLELCPDPGRVDEPRIQRFALPASTQKIRYWFGIERTGTPVPTVYEVLLEKTGSGGAPELDRDGNNRFSGAQRLAPTAGETLVVQEVVAGETTAPSVGGADGRDFHRLVVAPGTTATITLTVDRSDVSCDGPLALLVWENRDDPEVDVVPTETEIPCQDSHVHIVDGGTSGVVVTLLVRPTGEAAGATAYSLTVLVE